MRQYGLIVAALLAAFAIGYWAGHIAPGAARADAREASAPIARKPTPVGTATVKVPNDSRAMTSSVPGVAAMPAPRANAPLPPPGAPLKDTRAELEARAETGDAEAASRLFRDTQRCADVRRINAILPRIAQHALDQKNVDGLSLDALRARESELANYERQLSFSRDNAALCEGLSNDEINQLVPASMQAALLGDAAAADCYVSTGSFSAPQGLLDHPEWIADYKQNALAIANAAIDRGDWSMVGVLASAYGNNFMPTLISQLTGHDPVKSYRYFKLLSLAGSSGRATDFINRELTAMTNAIPAYARATGDAWAQQMFQSAFTTAPPPGRGFNFGAACHSEGL